MEDIEDIELDMPVLRPMDTIQEKKLEVQHKTQLDWADDGSMWVANPSFVEKCCKEDSYIITDEGKDKVKISPDMPDLRTMRYEEKKKKKLMSEAERIESDLRRKADIQQSIKLSGLRKQKSVEDITNDLKTYLSKLKFQMANLSSQIDHLTTLSQEYEHYVKCGD